MPHGAPVPRGGPVLRWLAVVVLALVLAGCAGNGSVQGGGGDRSGNAGRVGWRLAL